MKDIGKIIGAIIGILGFIAVIAGLSYALYAFSLNNNNTVNGSHDCIDIQYAKGTDVDEHDLNFVDSYLNSTAKTTITFNDSGNCKPTSVGTISIYTNPSTSNALLTGITTDGQSHGVLKYTIVKNSSPQDVYTGYITSTGDTNIDVGALKSSTTTYDVYLWLENDTTGTITNETISEATYSGYVHASARQTTTFR